jgi:type I restriction enzyme M protein
MPDSRKKYPKTKPIRYEEFSDCIRWWRRRKASDNAWYVPVEDVIARGYDLEIPNPSQVEEELPNNPAEVLEIVEKYHADLGAELGALRKLIEEIK